MWTAGLMAWYLVDMAFSWVKHALYGTLRIIRAMVPGCCRFLGSTSYPCERRELYRLINSGNRYVPITYNIIRVACVEV